MSDPDSDNSDNIVDAKGNDPNTDSPRDSKSPPNPGTNSPIRSLPSTEQGTPKSSGSFSEDEYVETSALRIYREDPAAPEDLVEVPQESTEYLEMRTCVNAAMRILSQEPSREAMKIYSQGMVEFMETKYSQSTAGDLDVYGDGVPHAIKDWLKKLKKEFPLIFITTSIGSDFGFTLRSRWGEHIKEYDPRRAATISIHTWPFERMCRLKQRMAEYRRTYTQDYLTRKESLEDDLQRARDGKDPKAIAAAEVAFKQYSEVCHQREKLCKNYKVHYERSLCHMAITIAHECFHVLTGYWSGFEDVLTPVKYFGHFTRSDRGDAGEAGEWWEVEHAFNGFIMPAWNRSGKSKDDPYPLDDENNSAGVLFIREKRSSDGGLEWTRVSHTFVRDIIEKGKSEYSYPRI